MTQLYRLHPHLVRSLFWTATLACLCLTLPVPAQADTIYTYRESGTYNQCQESYVLPGSSSNPVTGTNPCNGSIFLTVSFTTTLSASQLENLPFQTDISSTVTDFEFSDEAHGSGGFVDVNQDTPGSTGAFILSTDGAGAPLTWAVSDIVSGPARVEMCTSSESRANTDCTNRADNITYVIGTNAAEGWYPTVGWDYQLGTWTVTTDTPISPVPEPNTVFMLAGGLLCLSRLRRRDSLR